MDLYDSPVAKKVRSCDHGQRESSPLEDLETSLRWLNLPVPGFVWDRLESSNVLSHVCMYVCMYVFFFLKLLVAEAV